MTDHATFRHTFRDGTTSEARRHTNPDGSTGGIVAVSATVNPKAYIGPTAEVCDWARIADSARIADGARIGNSASIGHDASIGDGASIGNGASIDRDEWYITLGPQGSRGAMLTAVQKPDGLRWWVGCKRGITTDELRTLVEETHGPTAHGDDYRAVIAFVEAHPGRLRAEGEKG